MKVITKDFQILKGEHTFEFPQGITILQGESATGKSTLIYAILYCLTNPSGVNYCINHDTKFAEVTIENNGNSVTWVKTPTSSEYRNNVTGESFVKASKLDSRDIANLGFYFDPKGNVINIHHEWCVLFPYGLNDTELFKLFEDIFSISCSSQIIEDMKKDEQQVKGEINFRNGEIDKLKQQRTSIENILNNVDENKLQCCISNLKQSQDMYNQISMDYQTIQKYTPYLNKQTPKEYDIKLLEQTYNNLTLIKNDIQNYQKYKKLSTAVIPAEYILDIIENTIKPDYNTYVQTLKDIENYKQQLNTLDVQLNELQTKLGQIKVCPTCGKPLED